jgi:hypothetical protein
VKSPSIQPIGLVGRQAVESDVSGVSKEESESHPEQTLPRIIRVARENVRN